MGEGCGGGGRGEKRVGRVVYRVNTGPISKIFSGISSATIGMKL